MELSCPFLWRLNRLAVIYHRYWMVMATGAHIKSDYHSEDPMIIFNFQTRGKSEKRLANSSIELVVHLAVSKVYKFFKKIFIYLSWSLRGMIIMTTVMTTVIKTIVIYGLIHIFVLIRRKKNNLRELKERFV